MRFQDENDYLLSYLRFLWFYDFCNSNMYNVRYDRKLRITVRPGKIVWPQNFSDINSQYNKMAFMILSALKV